MDMFRRSSSRKSEPKIKEEEKKEELACDSCGETELVSKQYFAFTGCSHKLCGLCFAKAVTENNRSSGLHCSACNTTQKSVIFVEVKRLVSHHEKSEVLTAKCSPRTDDLPQPPRPDSHRGQRITSQKKIQLSKKNCSPRQSRQTQYNHEKTPRTIHLNKHSQESVDEKNESRHQPHSMGKEYIVDTEKREGSYNIKTVKETQKSRARSKSRTRRPPLEAEGKQRTRSQSRTRKSRSGMDSREVNRLSARGQVEPPGAKSSRARSTVRSTSDKANLQRGQRALSPMDVLKREQQRFVTYTE